MKPFAPLLLLAACLALSACEGEQGRATPVPVVTDTKPLGEGLKVIGYALLGSAVVLTLGRILR